MDHRGAIRASWIVVLLLASGCGSAASDRHVPSSSAAASPELGRLLPLAELFPAARTVPVSTVLASRLTFTPTSITDAGLLLGTATPLSLDEVASYRQRQAGRPERGDIYDPAAAVLVDPVTSSVTTVHRAGAGWVAAPAAADAHTVVGVDLLAAGPHGDDGIESGWRLWCLDRDTGVTRLLQAMEPHPGAASAPPGALLQDGVLRVLSASATATNQVRAYDGCQSAGRADPSHRGPYRLGRHLWADVVRHDATATNPGSQSLVVRDDVTGAARDLLQAAELDVRANAFGAVWQIGRSTPNQPVSLALWGAPARVITPALGGEPVELTLTGATDRAFVLDATGDRVRALALDPVSGAFADLAPPGRDLPRTVAASGRYVLVATASRQAFYSDYRFVDLGRTAVPIRGIDELTLPGRH